MKSSIYIHNNVENKNKDPKFEDGDGKTDIKTFLEKVPLQIGLNTFLWWCEDVSWRYVIEDVNREGIVGTFYEKELQKTNQAGFGIEKKKSREKVINYM